MARIVSLTVLTVLIVFLGITFFQVIAPFLLPLFLAGVIAIICQPVFRYLTTKTRGRTRVAAGLTTVAVLAIILVPILLGTFVASAQLFSLAHDTLGNKEWKEAIRAIRAELQIDHLAERLLPYVSKTSTPAGLDIEQEAGSISSNNDDAGQNEDRTKVDSQPKLADEGDTRSPRVDGNKDATGIADLAETSSQSDEEKNVDEANSLRVDQLQENLEANLKLAIESITQKTLGAAGIAAAAVPGAAFDIIGTLVSGLIGSVMFVIALYYFLADGPMLLAASESLVPVHVDYQRQLRKQFELVVRAVVLATFLAALIQGILTATAVSMAGFGHYFVLLLILSTFASLIPLAGTWLIWGPLAAWLAFEGHGWSAGILTLFGVFVIGTMDNVVRTYVLQNDAKLHPLLAFVSVLGGLQVMGLWGVFIGPIVASCLHALVQIFNTEIKELSKEKFAGISVAFGTGATAGAETAAGEETASRKAEQKKDDADKKPGKEKSLTTKTEKKNRRGGKSKTGRKR